jgi:hypothetical protein
MLSNETVEGELLPQPSVNFALKETVLSVADEAMVIFFLSLDTVPPGVRPSV